MDIVNTYSPPVYADGNVLRYRAGGELEDPAVIIQPYGGVLLACGERDDMDARYGMLKGVDPEGTYVLVPFAMGRQGGLSPSQAAWLIDALGDPSDSAIVPEFYRHLCLDDDVRNWIDGRIAEAGALRVIPAGKKYDKTTVRAIVNFLWNEDVPQEIIDAINDQFLR